MCVCVRDISQIFGSLRVVVFVIVRSRFTTHPHMHTHARVSIENKLDVEAMTALVPVLKMLSGLQSLELSRACVLGYSTRGRNCKPNVNPN